MEDVRERNISRAMPSAESERSYNGHYMDAGKKAEELVISWLKERPWVIGVDDFRNLRLVHEADIDVGVRLVDGRVSLAEIKSDWHLGVSGNVLFEILRINHTCGPERAVTLGWSARSPAIWFLLYAPQKNQIWQCKADALRESFQRYTRRERNKVQVKWIPTDKIKSTLAICIPEQFCRSIFTIYDLEE